MTERKPEVSVCWLRRDLRLEDNAALYHALHSNYPVLVIFIFDVNILDQLPSKKDKRVAFIHKSLEQINIVLQKNHSSLYIIKGTPLNSFKKLIEEFSVKKVFTNHDYEPYASERDLQIQKFLTQEDISFHTFKDQVIFEKLEIAKAKGEPYTIFTPYSKIWKQQYNESGILSFKSEKHLDHLFKTQSFNFSSLAEIGFDKANIKIDAPDLSEDTIRHYHETRNNPSVEGTTRVGVHLRFGTVSIRNLVKLADSLNEKWLNELIWREFFMMILFNFPNVVHQNFKKKYDAIKWRNNEDEFRLWCEGKTGYPMVDAGMRQLNETGWMHNRVRMVVASFLCKHLLIDWRWGEAYFAEKLLDYELSSNNGNWQWAAGTGCDAAPYFRIFNPHEQLRKFDPKLVYIKKWIPDFRPGYLPEMVKHEYARKRALVVYKDALQES
ncbi:MAG: deoxyribodipyrimidine photo-lyase [Ginsengibacter sp.]